jgi:hypothetical protein
VDVHLSVRACSVGVGPWRHSLESRRQPAPTLEVPKLRQVDLAFGFKKTGRRLLTLKREQFSSLASSIRQFVCGSCKQ